MMKEKKQAIIVTLFDDNNIGNRLQNYALCQVLFNYGVDVTVIDNGSTHVPNIDETFKIYIKHLLGCIGFKKYEQQYRKFMATKKIREGSYKFDERNIKNILKVNKEEAFCKDWSKYDVAFVGSDQVWHKWTEDPLELPFYYLEFLPESKRVAYASSFGFEEFPTNDIEQHEEGIKGMKYISCRERSGCKLVSNVTGKEVNHVLDPTLLLDVSDWRNIERQASESIKQQEDYIFVYFLGRKTEEYNNYIESIAKKLNINKIIDPLNCNPHEINKFGPCEFLSLIDNAKYVFTDSFHCTVFSILFDKSFTVFKRKQPGFEKMFARIEDLLSSKGKLDCVYGGTNIEASNNFDELYSNSLNYIDNVLKSFDNKDK